MSNSDGSVNDDACRIRREIEALKNEKSEINRKISDLETQLRGLKSENEAVGDIDSNGFGHCLSPDLIYRHSRHLMLPSFGVQGQSKLSRSSFFVVGAGGLGSPALLYLAACGVGRIGIVDHDVVELNNLHRQKCFALEKGFPSPWRPLEDKYCWVELGLPKNQGPPPYKRFGSLSGN